MNVVLTLHLGVPMVKKCSKIYTNKTTSSKFDENNDPLGNALNMAHSNWGNQLWPSVVDLRTGKGGRTMYAVQAVWEQQINMRKGKKKARIVLSNAVNEIYSRNRMSIKYMSNFVMNEDLIFGWNQRFGSLKKRNSEMSCFFTYNISRHS